jgi:hypothetical protein
MRITVKQLKRLIKEALSELPPKIDPSTYKPNRRPPPPPEYKCGLGLKNTETNKVWWIALYSELNEGKRVAKELNEKLEKLEKKSWKFFIKDFEDLYDQRRVEHKLVDASRSGGVFKDAAAAAIMKSPIMRANEIIPPRPQNPNRPTTGLGSEWPEDLDTSRMPPYGRSLF